MKQEIEASGKTVEAAILNGARELGVDRSLITYEILEMPKKGFLGFGEVLARVRVSYEAGAESTALEFVNRLIADMDLGATASVTDADPQGKNKLIKIEGGDAGVLIGHHGETMDSLQYLVNLVANKREEDEKSGDYMKITVDVENYRAKREDTLRQLARRMAAKVQKYKKSVTLEPMNPYERRIIHSEIQDIAGVTTTSIGAENNRKIVIYLENRAPKEVKEATGQLDASSDEKNNNTEGEKSASRPRRRRRRPKSHSANGENADSKPAETSVENDNME